MALPLDRTSWFTKVMGSLAYNFGRMITYALFGGLFGLIGQSIVIAGYQQMLSITLGVAILIMVLLPESLANKMRVTRFIYSYVGRVKARLAKLFYKSSYSSLFFIGSLNGMLPCGLVYLGIAGAIATGNSLSGSLFMAAFGLGTLPAMLGVSLAGSWISVGVRSKIRKAVPVFVGVMAVMLILRGMNLGIPYISPKAEITAEGCVKHSCCHK
jgi:sulfite exporter TauE/SafE